MNKRQRSFVQAYTNRADKETHGNATNSATYAGYLTKSAPQHGCKLLKKPRISQEITRIESEHKAHCKLTLDKKIAMLERAIEAETEGTHTWIKLIREHGDLCGDYTLKIEQKIDLSIEEEKERDLLMNRLLHITDIPNTLDIGSDIDCNTPNSLLTEKTNE